MKERMSDPMSTVRSTISIVLNVLRFCCMLFFSSSPYPEFSIWPITILQMEMLAYPGVKTRYLWQVQTRHKEKDGVYLRLRCFTFKLLERYGSADDTNDRRIHQ